MSPVETLNHEHDIILLVLTGVEQEAASIADTGRAHAAQLEAMLDFFRGFLGRCHHTKEEHHLFPRLLERGLAAGDGPVAVMLAEHAAARERVRFLAEALPEAEAGDAGAVAAVREHLTALVELLRAHIAKEDDVLFPLANRLLTWEDGLELAEAFERVEREEIGEGVHERYHQLAHELAAR